MKRIFIFFVLLMGFQAPAFAQTWTTTPTTFTLKSDGTLNVLGDGSDSRGGWAPAYDYEPADIPTNSAIIARDVGAGSGQYQTQAGGAAEAKARFDCNDAFDTQADPFLFPNQANMGHRHTVFGPVQFRSTFHNLTYVAVRNLANAGTLTSTCFGNGVNPTPYWEPELQTKKNGAVFGYRLSNLVTYYSCGATSSGPTVGDVSHCNRFARSWGAINGFNTADPEDCYSKGVIAAGNGQTGWTCGQALTAGRYTYVGNGFLGWTCASPDAAGTGNAQGRTAWAIGTGGYQPYLYTASGHPTLQCLDVGASGSDTYGITADFLAPGCWDGKNFGSPNMRGHVFNAVVDAVKGGLVCPNGSYAIIQFSAKAHFPVPAADVAAGNVWFSSDRMNAPTTPADPTSSDPCRQVGPYFCNGRSGHFDVLPAWDYGTGDNPGIMLKFFQSIGMTMRVHNTDNTTWTVITGDTPHEMAFGRINATTAVVTTNPVYVDGLTSDAPKISLNPPRAGIKRYYPLPVGTPLSGSHVMVH